MVKPATVCVVMTCTAANAPSASDGADILGALLDGVVFVLVFEQLLKILMPAKLRQRIR
jgi:hypothetical protein